MDEYNIGRAAVVGASGTMGSLVGGVLAQYGLDVRFISRTLSGANRGLERAMDQARSDTIRSRIACAEYEDLPAAVAESDWVIECVREDLTTKRELHAAIDTYRRPHTVVSTMTSSLPLSAIAEGRSPGYLAHFMGVHFFNPPTKLPLCEVATIPETDPALGNYMRDFLAERLRRAVVEVANVPAYVGNRIGFCVLNQAATVAADCGVALVDYLLGPYTGRAMAPLATLDLVGLDVYQAVMQSLWDHTDDAMHDTFTLPSYVAYLVANGHLGNKSGGAGGYYRRDIKGTRVPFDIHARDYVARAKPSVPFVERARDLVHVGLVPEAYRLIVSDPSQEAAVVRRLLCTYVSYSYLCVGEVTPIECGIDGIDTAMSTGFAWAPPSRVMGLLGGPDRVAGLLAGMALPIPDALLNLPEPTWHPADGRFFSAR